MVAPDGGYLGDTPKKGRSFRKRKCADFVMYIPAMVDQLESNWALADSHPIPPKQRK